MIRTEPAKKPARPRLAHTALPTSPPNFGSGAAALRWCALASAYPTQLLGGPGTGTLFRAV
ncbi:MAG: hypothetical protein QOF55_2461 [Thermoleophilaceae bacterium]|nr:hypothetical protein [Thermoleophilaceae bacterium]